MPLKRFCRAAALCLLPALALAQSPDMPAEKVFAMKALRAPRDLDEMSRLFSYVAGTSQINVDQSSFSLHVWGTVDQIAMAQWFQTILDEGPEAFTVRTRSLEHPNPSDSNDVAVVEYLPPETSVRDLQEYCAVLRETGRIRAVPITVDHSIALRGTASDIALANWIVDRVKTAPGWNAPPAVASYSVEQYRPGSSNDVTAVFQLAHARDPEAVQAIVNAIREKTPVTRMFQPRGVIVARGSASEIARAQQIVAEMDQPNHPPTALPK